MKGYNGEEHIEFDTVLSELETGEDIECADVRQIVSESNYDILRYYRDEYKDLLAEVRRLTWESLESRMERR